MIRTIAFVHGVSPIGGAERELLRYLDQLPQRGYRPVVVCPADGALAEAVKSRGIRAHPCEFPPWRKLSSLLRRRSSVDHLRHVFRACSPDVIHVNDIWWVPQSIRAAGVTDAPVVAHVRQEIEPSKVQRYELDRADLVLAVSRHIEDTVRAGGVKGERLRTLYSGLDLTKTPDASNHEEMRRRCAVPPDGLLLGTVANVFPRKGYDVMVDALARIVKTHPSVRYVIVGSGDDRYEHALRARARDLGLADRVHFAGFQQDVYPYVNAMDLYVQPSLMEGFGVAVIEAMAMGKAVVGTRTGGLPEVIEHQETGVLVPPNNAVALAEAIERLLQDPAKREQFGRAGQARVRNSFTIEAMMRGLTSAYEKVMALNVRIDTGAVS